MKLKVKTGFVEIKTKDKYLRSFLVATESGSARVNIWTNRKNDLVTVGVQYPRSGKRKKEYFHRGISVNTAKNILFNLAIQTYKEPTTEKETMVNG